MVWTSSKSADRRGWIKAALWVSNPDLQTTLKTMTPVWRPMRWSAWRLERQLAAYQHHGFWQCMDTLRDKRLLESLWHERRAPGSMEMSGRGFAGSPTFITARLALLVAGRRRLLCRRRGCRLPGTRLGCRRASWWRAGLNRSKSCRDVRESVKMERALGEYEVDTVIHLARHDHRGDRQSQPGLDF